MAYVLEFGSHNSALETFIARGGLQEAVYRASLFSIRGKTVRCIKDESGNVVMDRDQVWRTICNSVRS